MSATHTNPDDSFTSWKLAVQAAADESLPGLGNLWGPSDDYDLFDAARKAFAKGTAPEAFFDDMFAEDLARQAGDDDEYRESLGYEDDYQEEE